MSIARPADNPPAQRGVDSIDDLRRDVILDRLAGVLPECLGDLLELADRVIEVAA